MHGKIQKRNDITNIFVSQILKQLRRILGSKLAICSNISVKQKKKKNYLTFPHLDEC